MGVNSGFNVNRMPVAEIRYAYASDTLADALSNGWATVADRTYAHGRIGSMRARAVLRALLWCTTGRVDWVIGRAPNGQPWVRTTDGGLGPAVSLSHTMGMVAAAVGGSAVGIDVEWHRQRDWAALAAAAFGPAECQAVAADAAPADAAAFFYQFWTLREAVAKADGSGLTLVLNQRDLAECASDWQWRHKIAGPGHSLAIAWPASANGELVRVDLHAAAGAQGPFETATRKPIFAFATRGESPLR